jgi:hypothetical protein
MKHIILDLDNCIANDAWRIPKINWQKSNPMERYHDYHSLSGFDEPGNLDILEEHEGARVIIFTARPVLYSAVTHEWLRRNKIPYEFLVMRNNNDQRHSLDLKRTMLKWLPDMYDVPLDSIVAAYDDRPDVVAMYQSQDIPAFQKEIHNVCAYTAPHKEPA